VEARSQNWAKRAIAYISRASVINFTEARQRRQKYGVRKRAHKSWENINAWQDRRCERERSGRQSNNMHQGQREKNKKQLTRQP